MHRVLLSTFLLGILITATAGEVLEASVDHQGGEYNLNLSVKILGDRDTIYKIVTDHDQLPELSDIIVSSETISSGDGNDARAFRHRLVTRVCVLLFCFNKTVVEDVRITEQQSIQTTFVPELSDFEYGNTEWQILAVAQNQTIINYQSQFKPDFWVPPLIGPVMIKRTMLKSAEQIIEKIESIATSDQLRP